jgi:hypothetical protein
VETEYERRLRETAAQVEAHASMRVTRNEPGALADYLGDASAALEMIGKAEDVELPTQLKENFHRRSGAALAWRAAAPDEAVAGEFRLVHFGEALLAGESTWLTDMASSEEERSLFTQLRIFDNQPSGGTGTAAALRLGGPGEPPEIWYVDMTQGAMRLDLHYGAYLDTLLRVRGLYYWQYLFADLDGAEVAMSVAVPGVRRGLDFLARAFPEEDFDDLMSRADARDQD